jgi:hypothetical protein
MGTSRYAGSTVISSASKAESAFPWYAESRLTSDDPIGKNAISVPAGTARKDMIYIGNLKQEVFAGLLFS